MPVDTQSKPAAKHDGFVDEQLKQVRSRIHTLDVTRSAILFLLVLLGYGLTLAAFDLATGGAAGGWYFGVRIACFALFLVAGSYFLVQTLWKAYRSVNPFYAARELERTLPDAKNSVINWLDLKEQVMPGSIRQAVALKAAHDLRGADPEQAAAAKGNYLLGTFAGIFALGFIVLFIMGPHQFGSLLSRAYLPFRSHQLDTRVSIKLLEPDGDVMVPLNRRVTFRAEITGRIPTLGQPDAPRLLYRFNQHESYAVQPLSEDNDGNWSATRSSDQVRSGFWYKIAAGDAETPEYQLGVRTAPLVTRFTVSYHHRPYYKLPDATIDYPNEHAVYPRVLGPSGTEVTLVVHVNAALANGKLLLESMEAGKADRQEVVGQVVTDDPKAMSFGWLLERSGNFRVLLTSKHGEDNADRQPYEIEVLKDGAPIVDLTKPGADVSLPANGTLQLEGLARDDIGLTKLALQMRFLNPIANVDLAPKNYRGGKSFRFENGTYPDVIDYKDFVALEALKRFKGDSLELKEGDTLEYWLEATDNSDFPNPSGNLGKSKVFKVSILAPQQEQKKQDERRQAQDQQRQNDKKQDDKQSQENQKRNQQDQQKTGNGNQGDSKDKKDDLEKNLKQLAQQLNDQKKQDQQPKSDPDKSKSPPDSKNGGDGKSQENPSPSPKDGGSNPKAPQPPKNGSEEPKDKKENKGGAGSTTPGQGTQKDPSKNGKDGDNTKEPGANGQGTNNGGKGDLAKSGSGAGDNTPKAGNDHQPPMNGQPTAGNEPETMPPPNTNTEPKPSSSEGNQSAKPGKSAKSPDGKPALDTTTAIENGKDNKSTGNGVDSTPPKSPDSTKSATPKGSDNGNSTDAGSPPDGKGKTTDNDPTSAANGPGPRGPDKEGPAPGEKKTGPGKNKATTPPDNSATTKNNDKGGQAGGSGAGGQGVNDEGLGTAANDAFKKLAGNLQLKDLKEQVTPQMLKDAGLSEADWQDFLRKAAAYEKTTGSAAPKSPDLLKGGASSLANPAVRNIQGSGTLDPLLPGRALPPPELRRKQEQFTREGGKE